MTKAEWQLRERALTLYCTGKFTKAEAKVEAKAQLAREAEKRKPAVEPDIAVKNESWLD